MRFLLLAGVVVLVHFEVASAIDYSHVVNISMCNWAQPRANIIRDKIYLDGGYLWWLPGNSDGHYDIPQSDDMNGTVYELSLGLPFDTRATNLTALFTASQKNGSITSNEIVSSYQDGVMFANDDGYILYGGIPRLIGSQDTPDANQVLVYEAYPSGPKTESWSPGFLSRSLPDGVTNLVTNGAGVSAPSENLGFYFSGMRAKDWGVFTDYSVSPNITANTLITVDMSTMGQEKWTNDTLPEDVPGRANAELVWIPVSESGVLIAIGGVIYPESLESNNLTESQAAASKRISPTFMKTVPVYDVANKKWYMQNTTGDIPPQLTLFCSVVAAAADRSSFNIYIYGGYDGLDQTHAPSDDVYILSVPSFTWIRAYSGDYRHGRSGHKCLKVYPDQMFVLGGIFEDPTVCVDGGIIQVFNLNNLRFQDSYNPERWSEYEVPALVTAQIGGGPEGGATKTSPSSWNDDALEAVFASNYTKTIATYYPYPLASKSPTPSVSTVPAPPKENNKGSGLPTWVGPVLGVVIGLIVAATLIIGWLLYRRRQYRSAYGSTVTDPGNNRVLKWMYGTHMPPPKGSTTGTSTELGTNEKHFSGGTWSDAGMSASARSPSSATHEAAGFQVHELDAGAGGRAELATDFNSAENHSPLRQASFPPSLDGVLSTQDQHQGDRTSIVSSSADSQPARPMHRHQSSDLSSPLSDISEDPTEDLTRPRYVSGLSDVLVSPEEQKPAPWKTTKKND